MAEKVAGTAYCKVDGQQVSLEADMKLSPHDFERTGVVGLSGVVGFSEENVVPFVEMTAIKSAKTDIDKFSKVVDGTVTVELATGEVWAFRNAWMAGRIELDAAKGTFGLRFEALKAERTTSAPAGA